MKVRTILYADEGTILTDGTNYGTVIWLAEGVSPDTYYPITLAEYEVMMQKESEIM